MYNCCICGSPVGKSDAILMIKGKEAPICEACDSKLALLFEGTAEEAENASRSITGVAIAENAYPAVKSEIASIIKQARHENPNWGSEDSTESDKGEFIDLCAGCGRRLMSDSYYMVLKDEKHLCEKCATEAGLDLNIDRSVSVDEFRELSKNNRELQIIRRENNVRKACNDQLLIADSIGQFAVIGTSEGYLHFQTASLNNILDIKYYDDVQTEKVQIRKESSGAGSAVIGALLFGELGMVAGGLYGRKAAVYDNVTYISNCGFIVTYSNGEMAKFNLLEIIYGVDSTSPGSDIFRQTQSLTAAICKELAPYLPQSSVVNEEKPEKEKPAESDIATQLAKMAELVKEGFVTREEFDVFKKKLLGL